MMDKGKFAGVPFCVATPGTAARFIVDTANESSLGADIHFLNAYSIALAEYDPAYRRCLTNAAYNFPDGKPISLLNRLRSGRMTQVRGPGLFESVMDLGRTKDLRHYLLGSTPATLAKLQESLECRYPGVRIVGSFSPPFGEMTSEQRSQQDEEIRISRAQLVWVGLGTPKQDFEVARLAEAGFKAVAVGAAFDFSAGTKREAPRWVSKLGLEWLFRFATEPRRLWRRYLVGNLVFLRAAIRHGVN